MDPALMRSTDAADTFSLLLLCFKMKKTCEERTRIRVVKHNSKMEKETLGGKQGRESEANDDLLITGIIYYNTSGMKWNEYYNRT